MIAFSLLGQSQIEEPRQLSKNPIFIELMGVKVNAKRSAGDPGTPHNITALTTDRPSMNSSTVSQTNEINSATTSPEPSTTTTEITTQTTTTTVTTDSHVTTTPEYTTTTMTTTKPVTLSSRTTNTVANSRTTPAKGDASSREDSEDDFDHELAIIFGSMLGGMVLVFFCYGVVRCYRQEKVEFNKTQQNFTG